MPASTASLESLSSPSPSPPPSKQRAGTPPAQPTAPDTAGLDSGSELSELTEDEQETENNPKTSTRKQPARRTRRSLVPDQMWGWYKKKSEEKVTKVQDDADAGNRSTKTSRESEDDDDEDPEQDSHSNDPPPQEPAATPAAQSPSREGSAEEDSVDKADETNPADSDPDSDDVGDDDDDEEGTDSEEDEDPADEDPADSVAPSVELALATPLPEEITPMDVDIVPLAAGAGSSIMAGSTVLEAISPTSSASSSRSPSPVPEKSKPVEIEVLDAPAPAEHGVAEEEEADAELESELQPAHRAEALDVLATIELKFALLREKLYVEKMEALAWEESLLDHNNHPELIHLDEELAKRRDKRLELASRRRAYEVADANKRKRIDEDGVWSWWKFERDELQTDMLAETNRKRRRLQRESRSLERPPPIRRIPHIQHELPPAPTLREITRSMTYAYASGRMLAMTGAYPALGMLSGMEVEGDLEFLTHQRRGWDMHRPNMNHPFETYGPIEGTTGYGIIPPAVQPHHPGPGPFPGHSNNFPPRRSVSPPPLPPPVNGGLKATNGWMSGPGVVPSSVEERIPPMKEQKREEPRHSKEERDREMDRERNHQLQLIHQTHQRHQQQQQQPPPSQTHHISHHHHHVVHHHHPPPPGGPPSNNISPRRVARDLEFSRPRSGPPPSTEIIDLSSGSKRMGLTTSPVIPSNISPPHEPAGMPRLIDHLRPPSSSGLPDHPARLPPISTNLERIMTPFVIPPSQATQAHFSSSSESNSGSRRDMHPSDDLLRRPSSTTHLPPPIHSPSTLRPSNLNSSLLTRPQSASSPRNHPNRLPPLPPSRSPIGHAPTLPPLHVPLQPSPPFPTPASLMASSNGRMVTSSPKPPHIKQVIDPALSDISGPGGAGGRSGLILNVVELRNPNPSSLHSSSSLPSMTADVPPPPPAGRMNGVSVDGS